MILKVFKIIKKLIIVAICILYIDINQLRKEYKKIFFNISIKENEKQLN